MKNILCDESDIMIKAIEKLLKPLGFNIIEYYGQEISEEIDYFILSAKNSYDQKTNLSDIKKLYGKPKSKIIIISFSHDHLNILKRQYGNIIDHLYFKQARSYDLDALYLYNNFILK